MQFFSPNLQIQDSVGRSHAIGSAELRVISTDSIGYARNNSVNHQLTDDVEVMLASSQDQRPGIFNEYNSNNPHPMIANNYEMGFELNSGPQPTELRDPSPDMFQYNESPEHIPIIRDSQMDFGRGIGHQKSMMGNLSLGMQQKPIPSFKLPSAHFIPEDIEYDFTHSDFQPAKPQVAEECYGLLDSELDSCLGSR
jgi:hypothetical protein